MRLTVNNDPSKKELQRFGLTLAAAFSVLGGLLLWRGKFHVAYWVWCLGIPAGLLGALGGKPGRLIYRLWMTWAYYLANAVTQVVLAVLFFMVITPVGILFRLIGRDALGLRKAPNQPTYWKDLPKITSRSYYRRLF